MTINVKWGSGKGAFCNENDKNRIINYIGIDIQKSVLSYALDKVLRRLGSNIKLYGLMVQNWPSI